MKLSKQERIAAVVVMVIIILALGGFLLVKPKVEDMLASKSAAEAKQTEYNEDYATAQKREPLKEDILKAYEKGSHIADMFFPEFDTYEADDAFREFLGQLESKVAVEQYTIDKAGTVTLGTIFPTEESVEYDLKTYATQGADMSAEEAKILARQEEIASYLGEPMTIGSSNINCTISYISPQEMLTFVDEVNNYVRDENGEQVRKAISIPGYELNYGEVQKKYDKLIEQYNKAAEAEGRAALRKATGLKLEDDSNQQNNNNNNNNQEETAAITDHLFSLSTTFTFYSIERMQDPKAQLDAQDGIYEETEDGTEGSEGGEEETEGTEGGEAV